MVTIVTHVHLREGDGRGRTARSRAPNHTTWWLGKDAPTTACRFLVVRPTTGTASSSVRTSSAPVPCSAWRRAWAICCSVNRGFFSAILPSVEDRRHRHVLKSNRSSFVGAGPCCEVPSRRRCAGAVSYTHLTLPTIYSV